MSAPPSIPDHVLLRSIGRGAYGEVWLARNVMGAPRAVKIIWRRQFDSDRPYERELAGIQRYEPVSRMTDGLVQVLHVGRNEAEGYFYYVMELAEGAKRVSSESVICRSVEQNRRSDPDLQRADSLMTDYSPRTLRSDLKCIGRLPVADCLQIALDAVSGLTRLHQHGLVHRDVKPGNIIFVNGRAKLADIGLVSLGGEGRTFVGTEGYIPPEGPGTAAADIYALGMCLYEAATGYSPDEFPKVPAEWFSQEISTQPVEFQEIVHKACEGDRKRRYQNAEQMQADLALMQSGQSVRRLRALERRIVRFRALGIGALLSVVLALGGVLLANYRTRIEAENRSRESALRQRAEVAEHDARQQLYAALLREAHATVQSRELGQRVRALDAIRRAAAISNAAELRREAFAAFAQPDLRFEREWHAGTNVTFMSLDPNFERVAVGRGKGAIEIRSLRDNQLVATLPPGSTNRMSHVGTWSADGRFLAVKRDHNVFGDSADLEIWNVTNEHCMLLRDVSWGCVSFHPDGHRLLVGRTNSSACVLNLEDGRELSRFVLPDAPVHLKFSPDGARFAALCSPAGVAYEMVSVHDARSGAALWSSATLWTNGSTLRIAVIDWHPGGQWLAMSDHDGAVIWINAATGEARVLGEHKAQAATVEFTPEGRYLFSGGWEREFICWDFHTLQRVFTIAAGGYEMQIRRDGRQCAIRTETGLQLHAIEMPIQRDFVEELGPRLRRADFSSDGRWLTASAEKQGAVWDLAQGGPAALLEEAAGTSLFFTPDGHEVFGSFCGRWRITPATDRTAAPQLAALPIGKPEGFMWLCLASNSVVFTTAKGSQILTLENLEKPPDRWERTAPGISRTSPDGRWLGIHSAFSPSLYIYALPSFKRVAKLIHPAGIGGFQFSPSTEEVAIHSSRAGVEFWSTATWQRTRVLTNFTKIIMTSDGLGWWLMKDLRTAGLHEPKTLRELLPLPAGTLPLAISPDGRRLAVSVDARRLQLWDLADLRKRFRELGVDWED